MLVAGVIACQNSNVDSKWPFLGAWVAQGNGITHPATGDTLNEIVIRDNGVWLACTRLGLRAGQWTLVEPTPVHLTTLHGVPAEGFQMNLFLPTGTREPIPILAVVEPIRTTVAQVRGSKHFLYLQRTQSGDTAHPRVLDIEVGGGAFGLYQPGRGAESEDLNCPSMRRPAPT
jgi:hypothetical protein